MKRNIIISSFLLFLVVGLIFLRSKSAESTLTFEAAADNQITRVAIGDRVFNVEIAQTEEQKAQGLSGREKLDKNSGMIFIFKPPTIPSFWMRDMRFALDFVWINEDLEVVDITRNVPPPEPNTPLADLPLFSPRSEVKYVLEINAGETSGISIGDRVQIFDTSSL